MDNFQVGKHALLWGYVSQLFQYGSAIFILPFILNRLPAEDMAVWYIFISIHTIVGLVDFGFSPSLSKQVSFVFSGVGQLYKDGVKVTSVNNSISYSLLNDLYKTCILLYRNIAFTIGGLMLSLGSLYIFYALDTAKSAIWLPWLLYIVSLVYSFYYNYILIFIRGRGLISELNKLIIISKAVYLLSIFILIFCDLGLLSLVIANFLSTIIMRIVGEHYVLNKNERQKLSTFDTYNNLFGTIWYNAKRYGITNLGVALLAQSNIFLGGLFLSIESVGELGLTIQIFSILVVLSKTPLNSYSPKISSLFVAGDLRQIKQIFIRCQTVNYIIYFVGSIIIIMYGNIILSNIIHSNTLLPSKPVLYLYFFFYLMELTHGNCVSVISAENRVPFYKASIISGIISVTVTFSLLYLQVGIYSFPIGLISGSLPYNSWKWPLVLYKRLNYE